MRHGRRIRPILPLLAVPAALLLAAPAALAQIPEVVVVDLEFAPQGPVSLLAVPDGSGTPFTAAFAQGGEVVDATVRFRIVEHGSGAPIQFYPWEDVWLEYDFTTAIGCNWATFSADADTDENGTVEFTGPLEAGGYSQGTATVMIAGVPARDEYLLLLDPLPISYNSPDLTGDLAVDLGDIATFTLDLGQGAGYRSDFNYDGVINLSDIVVLAQHLGTGCN